MRRDREPARLQEIGRSWSDNDDNLDPNGIVGTASPGVAARERHLVLLSREGYERVVYSTTREAEPAQRFWNLAGASRAQRKRRRETCLEKPHRICRSDSRVPGKPRQNRIGLWQRVSAQRELLSCPPRTDRKMVPMRLDKQRNRNAGIDRDRHLRLASISAKTTASSISVSLAETRTPFSSTRRAVRPAGTTCTPAPYGEMSTVVPGCSPSESRIDFGSTIRPAWSMIASMGKRYHPVPTQIGRAS